MKSKKPVARKAKTHFPQLPVAAVKKAVRAKTARANSQPRNVTREPSSGKIEPYSMLPALPAADMLFERRRRTQMFDESTLS